MTTIDDRPTLEQDATLDETLRRVAYEAGMMLGLEATRDEQHMVPFHFGHGKGPTKGAAQADGQ